VIWEVTLPGAVFARPIFDGQGHIVVADAESDLRAYTREGAPAWHVDVDNQGARVPAPQPAVGRDGSVYAMTVGRDQIVRIGADGSHLGTISTARDWHSDVAVGADGSVFASDDDGLRVYAATGELMRLFATPGPIVEPVRFGTGGRVFVAAEHGGVFVLGPDGGVEWELLLPDLLRGTPFEAPDGTIFVGALGYGLAYQYDATGQPHEELPYCDEPDGFTTDGQLVVCTRHARVYALDLQALQSAAE
jgi:outer membrane protein assembly factor BamB